MHTTDCMHRSSKEEDIEIEKKKNEKKVIIKKMEKEDKPAGQLQR